MCTVLWTSLKFFLGEFLAVELTEKILLRGMTVYPFSSICDIHNTECYQSYKDLKKRKRKRKEKGKLREKKENLFGNEMSPTFGICSRLTGTDRTIRILKQASVASFFISRFLHTYLLYLVPQVISPNKILSSRHPTSLSLPRS